MAKQLLSLGPMLAVLVGCGGKEHQRVEPATIPLATDQSDKPRVPTFGALHCPEGTAAQHHDAVQDAPTSASRSHLSRLGCAGSYGPRSNDVEKQVMSACQGGVGRHVASAGNLETWSCHMPDGTLHGPFQRRRGTDKTANQAGQYENGEAVGEVRFWTPEGQPSSVFSGPLLWERRFESHPRELSSVFPGHMRLHVLGTPSWRIVVIEAHGMDAVVWLGAEQRTAPAEQRDAINRQLRSVLFKGNHFAKNPGLHVVTGQVYPECERTGRGSFGMVGGGGSAPKQWSYAQLDNVECLNTSHRAWRAKREEYRLYNGTKEFLGSWEAELIRGAQRQDVSFEIRLQQEAPAKGCLQFSVSEEEVLSSREDCLAVTVSGDTVSIGTQGSRATEFTVADGEAEVIDVIWMF